MKVRVRTRNGEFKDDRFHFTTKWTEVEESEIGSVHLENPKLEVQYAKDAAAKADET